MGYKEVGLQITLVKLLYILKHTTIYVVKVWGVIVGHSGFREY